MAAPLAAQTDTYRIATYAAPLSRDGPGLLLRDVLRADDAQIAAVLSVVVEVAPDVLVLTDFDYDLDGRALAVVADRAGFAHSYASLPNSGMSTGLDMDGDGYLGGGVDAQGFGKFAGDGGLAILSQHPIVRVEDFSELLWVELDDAVWPVVDGDPFPSAEALSIQRLSSTAHWSVTIQPEGAPPFEVIAYDATPPVFDGPEDQNGLRNRDELRLIAQIAHSRRGAYVVAGNANLDPHDGQGIRVAMRDFLASGLVVDPKPKSAGARLAADPAHQGPPALDTANWPDDGPGNLRVSYVLPSPDWQIVNAGVFWPTPDDPKAGLLGDDGLLAGPHHLVWVDVAR